jgi:hypothetical protein
MRTNASQLPWSTVLYTVLALVLSLTAFLLNPWQLNWAPTVLLTLAFFLAMEFGMLWIRHRPEYGRLFLWGLFLLLALLLLIG